MTSDDFNPYRTFETAPGEVTVCEVAFDSAAPQSAELVRSGLVARHVRLSGRISTEIRWNARWFYEYVSVDGKTVASEAAYFTSVPRFAFAIQAGGRLHMVTVDVCVAWFFYTKSFRIRIDNNTVYSEGDTACLADERA